MTIPLNTAGIARAAVGVVSWENLLSSYGAILAVKVVALLGAAVVMVPVFRRLGLGSVLGYLLAGLAIGPFGLGLFTDAHAILHVAELGVVMFLFIIGLELRPQKLWTMRGQIFGLGLAQVSLAVALLTAAGMLLFGLLSPLLVLGSTLSDRTTSRREHREAHAQWVRDRAATGDENGTLRCHITYCFLLLLDTGGRDHLGPLF